MIPNILTLLGLCAGLTACASRWRAGSAPRRWRSWSRLHRRAGRAAGAAAEGDVAGSAPSSTAWPISAASASRRRSSCISGRCRRWRGFGFVPCLMFAVCMALRLARFNAALDARAVRRPTPTISSPACRRRPGRGWRCSRCSSGWRRSRSGWHWLLDGGAASRCSAPLVLVGTALLLVSTLPVWSFKNFKVPARIRAAAAARRRRCSRRCWWPIPGPRWRRRG